MKKDSKKLVEFKELLSKQKEKYKYRQMVKQAFKRKIEKEA
tara:strand:- start:56 stop:178 length:123 start_codon:yes stop_codon:yes gene_type:complete